MHYIYWAKCDTAVADTANVRKISVLLGHPPSLPPGREGRLGRASPNETSQELGCKPQQKISLYSPGSRYLNKSAVSRDILGSSKLFCLFNCRQKIPRTRGAVKSETDRESMGVTEGEEVPRRVFKNPITHPQLTQAIVPWPFTVCATSDSSFR